jgi:hypothetical protein
MFEWDADKSNDLAEMIFTRSLQVKMSSVRKYLNIANNFYAFLQFNPEYEENFDTENDFVVNLLIIKEVWQSLYEFLVKESFNKRSVISSILSNNEEKISSEQKEFLKNNIGGWGSSAKWGREKLHVWVLNNPSLA